MLTGKGGILKARVVSVTPSNLLQIRIGISI